MGEKSWLVIHVIRDEYPNSTRNSKYSTLHRINITTKKWANEFNREFSKKEVQMTNKYMKKYTTFLTIKEM
jgi:hypothetical protein